LLGDVLRLRSAERVCLLGLPLKELVEVVALKAGKHLIALPFRDDKLVGVRAGRDALIKQRVRVTAGEAPFMRLRHRFRRVDLFGQTAGEGEALLKELGL
jgi:hypothetical protein